MGGGRCGSQQSPWGTCQKEEGHSLRHLNSAGRPESLSKRPAAPQQAWELTARRKCEDVISGIPRTAAWETFPKVFSIGSSCVPPSALAPHALKERLRRDPAGRGEAGQVRSDPGRPRGQGGGGAGEKQCGQRGAGQGGGGQVGDRAGRGEAGR